MKRKIRNAFCWLLASIFIMLGYVNKAKRESLQNDKILSVYFHNPNRNLFQKILNWLRKNGFVFISCEQLIEILNKRMECPSGAVWISLDDGWRDNIDNVIPIAQEYHVPITIFIYTSAVETGTFWWKRAKKYARLFPPEYRDIRRIWNSPEDVRKRLVQSVTAAKTPGSVMREAMTVDDIRYICAIPEVTIGSHTVTHPILKNCDNTQLDFELRESKKKLENWTGKQVKAFAYPKGFFTSREKSFLKKHGYELAVTIQNRFVTNEDDLYLLPRTDVMNDGSFSENLCHMLGVWEPLISKCKRVIKLARK